MRDTFATATRRGDRAVVLLMQADMFDESYGGPSVADPADYSAFSPLVQAIVDEASAFDGPVYLFNGDSHEYRADAPLAAGSPRARLLRGRRQRGQPRRASSWSAPVRPGRAIPRSWWLHAASGPRC